MEETSTTSSRQSGNFSVSEMMSRPSAILTASSVPTVGSRRALVVHQIVSKKPNATESFPYFSGSVDVPHGEQLSGWRCVNPKRLRCVLLPLGAECHVHSLEHRDEVFGRHHRVVVGAPVEAIPNISEIIDSIVGRHFTPTPLTSRGIETHGSIYVFCCSDVSHSSLGDNAQCYPPEAQ